MTKAKRTELMNVLITDAALNKKLNIEFISTLACTPDKELQTLSDAVKKITVVKGFRND